MRNNLKFNILLTHISVYAIYATLFGAGLVSLHYLIADFKDPALASEVELVAPSPIKALYNKAVKSYAMIKYHHKERGGTGSGVYVRPYLLVTNYHVIQRAFEDKQTVSITVNGITIVGEIVEAIPSVDLALVYTREYKGIVSTFAPQFPEVGDRVISIGSSYGYRATLGVGYVTGIAIDTDGRIATLVFSVSTGLMPGNSGGGVYNEQGQIVGIAFAAIQNDSILGFVIPGPIVESFVERYMLRNKAGQF